MWSIEFVDPSFLRHPVCIEDFSFLAKVLDITVQNVRPFSGALWVWTFSEVCLILQDQPHPLRLVKTCEAGHIGHLGQLQTVGMSLQNMIKIFDTLIPVHKRSHSATTFRLVLCIQPWYTYSFSFICPKLIVLLDKSYVFSTFWFFYIKLCW